jgi:hypothetical protein
MLQLYIEIYTTKWSCQLAFFPAIHSTTQLLRKAYIIYQGSSVGVLWRRCVPEHFVVGPHLGGGHDDGVTAHRGVSAQTETDITESNAWNDCDLVGGAVAKCCIMSFLCHCLTG